MKIFEELNFKIDSFKVMSSKISGIFLLFGSVEDSQIKEFIIVILYFWKVQY